MKTDRRRDRYTLSFVMLMVLNGLFGQAGAACLQTNLTGTWQAVGVSGNSNLGGFEEYIRCKIVLNSTGGVVPSLSACIGRDNVGRFTVDITGGSMRVGTACNITGSLTFYAGATLRHIVEFGQMALDKNIFTFTSYQSTNPDLLTVFTAVKQ